MVRDRSADRTPRSAPSSSSGAVCWTGDDSTTPRPAEATIAATATGRSMCVKRLRYSSRSSMLTAAAAPETVTPMFGTESASTWRSSENEKVSVPTKVASTTFWSRSRYHRRMSRGDSVPVACCTTSTPMVTTKPSSATIAPTSTLSTPVAVEGEYCQAGGTCTVRPSWRHHPDGMKGPGRRVPLRLIPSGRRPGPAARPRLAAPCPARRRPRGG
jgi:hypothetical protein